MPTLPPRSERKKPEKPKRNIPMMFVPVFLVLMAIVFILAKRRLESRSAAGVSAGIAVPVGAAASVSGDEVAPTPSPTPQSALITMPDGTTVQFEGAEPVNLEKELGYFACAPANGAQIPLGVTRLALYFARADLACGDGVMRIVSGDVVLHSRSFKEVECRLMTQQELSFYGYIEGCCFIIELNTPLTLAGDMRVELSEGCIVSTRYQNMRSGAWGANGWRFRVLPFGVSACGSVKPLPDVSDVSQYNIVLGGDATQARVENHTPKIANISAESFTETGVLELVFREKGQCRVTVTFYDKNGALVGDSAVTITTPVGSGLLKPLE